MTENPGTALTTPETFAEWFGQPVQALAGPGPGSLVSDRAAVEPSSEGAIMSSQQASTPQVADRLYGDLGGPGLYLWRPGLEVQSLKGRPLAYDTLVLNRSGGTVRRQGYPADEIARPGDFTFNPKGNEDVWQFDGTVEYMHLVFAPGQLEAARDQALPADTPHVLVDRHGVRDGRLSRLADYVLNLDWSTQRDALMMDSLWHLFAVETVRVFAERDDDPQERVPIRPLDPDRTARIKAYIEDHLAEPLRLRELSDLCAMEETTFMRAFKAALGVSPYHYVLERRVARARDLLAVSELSLAEIAHRVGFSSQAHMTTTFRKLLDTTPGRLRRSGLP